jgi:long-subunit fatty acid transport protein
MLVAIAGVALLMPVGACGQSSIMLQSPGSPFDGLSVDIFHIDPAGSLLPPPEPKVPPPSPPTIFSAPLPSGSGARALGVAGAFTAIADDATAASWNPGGLIQLERPEVSFVWRGQREQDRHWSGDGDYTVGHDSFDGSGLNYLSVVLPFRAFDHNMVFSLNYQEVFDFTQRYHARFRNSGQTNYHQFAQETYTGVTTNASGSSDGFNYWSLNVVEYLTTYKESVLDQVLNTSTLGALDFDQEGVVTAFSPAFAVEVTPTLSFGAAVNIYGEGWLGTPLIRTRTRAVYSGTAESLVTFTDTRTTDGTYTWDGEWNTPPFYWAGGGSGVVSPFTNTTVSTTNTTYGYRGMYAVDDRLTDFSGVNATFGGLWNVSRELALGFNLELPWTARASQRRTVRTSVTMFDETGTVELGHTNATASASKDVAFHFPLSWSLGGAWRWNDRFTTSLDVSETLWSQYYFKSAGEGKINPLDGTRYGEHKVQDCWSARLGAEYLCLLQHTELPLRAGLSWEQRPAIGDPDEYWGFSVGTGISLGSEPGKVILDVAYSCTMGQDVMGSLVPGQKGKLATDVVRQEVFVSCIVHF